MVVGEGGLAARLRHADVARRGAAHDTLRGGQALNTVAVVFISSAVKPIDRFTALIISSQREVFTCTDDLHGSTLSFWREQSSSSHSH